MSARVLRVGAVFVAAYLVLHEVSLRLAFGPDAVPAFSAATGVGVAVLVRYQRARWPLLAAMVALSAAGSLWHGSSLWMSVSLGVVGAGEAAFGGWVLNRLRPAGVAPRPRWVLGDLLVTSLLTAGVGAAASTAAGVVGGHLSHSLTYTWWAWVAADALGLLVMVPAARAAMAARSAWVPTTARLLEALALSALQAGVLGVVFLTDLGRAMPWQYVLLPALLWAVLRFGPQGLALLWAGSTLAVMAGTSAGQGPFAQASTMAGDLVQAQSFCLISVLMGLLAAEVIAAKVVLASELAQRSSAMELAVEGIAYLDTQGCYQQINNAYCVILGVEPEQVLGHGWEPTVHPDDRPRMRAAHAQMLEHGAVTAEVRGLRPDGTLFYQELSMVADRDAGGTLLGSHCFLRDITVRRTAAEHVDQMFRLSPELLCVIDAQGCFSRVNPAWQRTMGHSAEQLLGRTYLSFVHPSDMTATMAEWVKSAGGAESIAFENRFRDADGSYRWLRWNSVVDRASGMVYAVAHDIANSKEIESSLAAARDQAMEASRMKSQFLAMMSHEIRTPMNGVIGLTDLLADTTLDPVQRRYVDGVRGAGSALLRVINDILDFSKIEAGKFVLDSSDFRLPAVIADVAALTAQPAAARGLQLTTDLDRQLPCVVRGDPGRIRQILLNLVGNAVKFTHEGAISIRAHPYIPQASGAGPGVRIEVADTGIGMDAAALGRLFEPFTQADASTTRTYGGTGLGLAISRQLAEAMGGTITVDSTVGVGTTFTLTLPLPAVTSTELVEPVDPSRLRVLVVDDSATNLLTLAEQVRGWGMHADVAEGPVQAEQLLRRAIARGHRYDVAIVDMKMPGRNGLELAADIAADPAVDALPVILMTSGEAISSTQRRRAGIGATLTKPVSRSDLYDALTATTMSTPGDRQTEPERGTVLLVEDNEINEMVATGILAKLGYTVDVAHDGLEALDAAGQRVYQVILMDCQMPNMDGYTATATLRRRALTAHTPIIAMTANAFAAERERCLEAGMDDYLPKPVSAHDLEAMLTRWTSRTSRTSRTRVAAPGTSAASGHDSTMAARLGELLGERTPADVDLLRKVIGTFAIRAPQVVADIGAAIDDDDDDAIGFHAHCLKGSAGTVGAQEVADACVVIENLARAHDSRTARPHHARLTVLLEQALTELADTFSDLCPQEQTLG